MSLISPKTARGPSRVRIKRPSERRNFSRSAIRALDVMELFGQTRKPLRAIEICRALAMRASSTDQLLKSMVDSAHLLFDAKTKTYRPSPRLAQLGCWIVETYGADERLRRLIRNVHSHTGLVVTLTTPNDLDMQILDLAVPPGPATERGLRISVFGSVIGSAYLATLPESEIARLALRARIPKTELMQLLKSVADVRRDGYADGATAGSDMWSIAVPLPDGRLPVPMVLGLAGAADHVLPQRQMLQQQLRRAVAEFIASEPDSIGRQRQER